MAWHWSFLDLVFSLIKIRYDDRRMHFYLCPRVFYLGMHTQAELFWKFPIQIEPYHRKCIYLHMDINAFLGLIIDFIQIA